MRSWIVCVALVLSCKPDDGIDEELFALCDDDVDGFVEAECAKADPDGVYDCDDADPNAFPGAPEACNGVDDDCDGTIDNGPVAVFFDGDNDGYGGDATTKCGVYDGYVDIGGDCNDDDADVHPGATEVCNGVDDDCIDGEQDATDAPPWYADTDLDGHGDVNTTVIGCAPGAGWSESPDDCDDTNSDTHPGALEVCDDADNNCDGATDEDATDAPTWFRDADEDGHGWSAETTTSCTQPALYAESSDDCDDDNKVTYPGATELCDLADNDCDTLVDEGAVNPGTYYRDADQDSFGNPAVTITACGPPSGFVVNASDCNDASGAINPLASEKLGDPTCNNGVDDNCDTFGCEPRGAISLPSASAYWVIKGAGPKDRAGGSFVGADVDLDAKGDDDLIIAAPGTGTNFGMGTYVGGSVYSLTGASGNTLLSTQPGEISADSARFDMAYAPTACDMNDDGRKDIIFPSSDSYRLTATWTVRVFRSTVSSATNLLSPTSLFQNTSDTTADGGRILACGDQNADSMDDLFIGAPLAGASDEGALWILRGRSTGYAATHDLASAASGHYTITAGAAGDALGTGVAVGDTNSDGRDDFAVGATGADGGGADAGAIYVFTDSNFPANLTKSVATASATFRGEVAGDKLGGRLTMGDFNGDGKSDIAAIAGNDLYLIFGRATWSAPAVSIATADLVRRSSPGIPSFVGDLNNDGFDELTVANASTVFLWYGGASVNLASAAPDATISLTSTATNGRMGDIDGDGYDDLFVGSPYDDATGTDAGALFGLRGAGR